MTDDPVDKIVRLQAALTEARPYVEDASKRAHIDDWLWAGEGPAGGCVAFKARIDGLLGVVFDRHKV